jgi:hypothetical protein
MIFITRTSTLVFGIIGLFSSVFGFYSYFGSTKYDLVTLNGTLLNSGVSNFNGKEGNDSFEFHIKEKPNRFQTGQLSYKYFKKNMFDSFGMSGANVYFEISKSDEEKINQSLIKPYENVWVYSFRDEKYTYLSLEDTKKSDSENRKYGLYLGIGFLTSSALLFWHRTTLPKSE